MMLLSGSKLVSFALDRPPVISPLPLLPFHKLSGRAVERGGVGSVGSHLGI